VASICQERLQTFADRVVAETGADAAGLEKAANLGDL
jgi:hypothetical protein